MSTTVDKCFTYIDANGKLRYKGGSYGNYAEEATKRVRSHAIDIVTSSKVSSEEKTQVAKNLELFKIIINHSCWDSDEGNKQAILDMRTYLEDLEKSHPKFWSDASLTNISTVLVLMRTYLSQYESKTWLGKSNYSDMMNAFHRAIKKPDFELVINAILDSENIDSGLKTAIRTKIQTSGNTLEEYRVDGYGVVASL